MRRILAALLLAAALDAHGQARLVSVGAHKVSQFEVAYGNLTGIAASKLLGRGSASAGAAQEITLGTGLTMTGTTLDASGGGLSGGTAGRLGIWTAADAMSSHAGLLADSSTGALTIGAQSDLVPVTLRAYSSGTSNIAQWQTSANVPLGDITHTGGLRLWGLYSGGGTDYESYTLSATAGSGVTLAAATGGAGVDNLDITLTPAGTGVVTTGTAQLKIPYGTAAAPGLVMQDNERGLYAVGGGVGLVNVYGAAYVSPGDDDGHGLKVGTNGMYAFSASADPGTASTLILAYDASDVLAQRRTTNAQTHRIYGTHTDASNYVRASLSATSTAVTLASETAGTGADDVDVNITAAGAGDTRLKIGAADRAVIAGGTVTLTESSATPILDVAVASGTVAGGEVLYTIRADDATDFQALTGRVQWSAVNKGGTLTATIALVGTETTAVSAGTLTNTPTITTGTNSITINLNAVSSLTQTTLLAYVQAQNNGTGAATTK